MLPDNLSEHETAFPSEHELGFDPARLTLSGHISTIPGQEERAPTVADLHRTDLGNAQAMALLYGHCIRYDHRRARWLVWNEHRWEEDTNGAIERLAHQVARERLRAAADMDDKQERRRAAGFALASESRRSISAMLSLAQSLEPLALEGTELDQNDWLLGCENGVIDLRLDRMHNGMPSDMLTMSTRLYYDQTAGCPRWEQFLQEVFSGDQELIAFIKRAIGYSLTGVTSEQVLFLCWGTGCNGKSTFLNVLRGILGDYARNTPFSTFEVSKYQGIPNDLAALSHVRLITASETAETTRLNEARVKAVTGGDPISCRFMRGEWFEYIPAFKVWLAMNHKPEIRGTDNAIWRRIRLIPFRESFEHRKDPFLEQTLVRERPGILSWAVEGCQDWQVEGLGMPAAVRDFTAEYRRESDLIGRFLEECTEPTPLGSIGAAALYEVFKGWLKANGEEEITSTMFGRRMMERGVARTESHTRRYVGIRLRNTDPEEPETVPF